MECKKRAAPAALFDVARKSLSHNPDDEVEDERDGDAEDTDEVDVDTGLDHLRDRDVAGRVDDGVRRCRHGQHKAQ